MIKFISILKEIEEDIPKKKLSVPMPTIGSWIHVYHPSEGGVKMQVVGRNGNKLECDYEGIEYSVRLATDFGDNTEWRWSAEPI